jgi:hypothetical protein
MSTKRYTPEFKDDLVMDLYSRKVIGWSMERRLGVLVHCQCEFSPFDLRSC